MTVTGTVTNANGSPGAGTVQLYVSMPLSLATMHGNMTGSSCHALLHAAISNASPAWLCDHTYQPAMAALLMQQ